MEINLEWMERKEYIIKYGAEKDEKTRPSDEYVVALTFRKIIDDKNEKLNLKMKKKMAKGAALCLPSSGRYKLAIASAKKRWEIEWISSNWYDDACDDDDDDDVFM